VPGEGSKAGLDAGGCRGLECLEDPLDFDGDNFDILINRRGGKGLKVRILTGRGSRALQTKRLRDKKKKRNFGSDNFKTRQVLMFHV
jgi:hypothetical protein